MTLRRCACKKDYISYTNSVGLKKCAAPCLNLFFFNMQQEKCICKSGMVDEKGVCEICERNVSVYNETTNSCDCLTGFMKLDVNCVPCSENAQYVVEERTCNCNTGYVGTGFICRKKVMEKPKIIVVVTTSSTAPSP